MIAHVEGAKHQATGIADSCGSAASEWDRVLHETDGRIQFLDAPAVAHEAI